MTSSFGPDAAFFSAGDAVHISYDLDLSAIDANADLQSGVFPNAVQSLSVSFPGLGINVTAGPGGTAQTFDNFVDTFSSTLSDQVFVFGGPLSSSSLLGGQPIDFVEVDFLSHFLVAPFEPLMLSSEALPAFQLPTIDAFVSLGTSNGFTSVDFADASPPGQSPGDPILPAGVDPSTGEFIFEGDPSGAWFDPPFVTSYDYVGQGGGRSSPACCSRPASGTTSCCRLQAVVSGRHLVRWCWLTWSRSAVPASPSSR